jgi:steroid delta-isomerase-like uncharacterized protein
MSIENNKLAARHFGEVWGQGDPAIVDTLAHPELVVFYPALGQPINGRDAFKNVLALFHHAFPDLSVTVEDEVAEGDKVALRWTLHGTHRAEIMGVPPSGKTASWTGITIYRLVEGQVIEERGEGDTLCLLRQLGAIPSAS